MLRTIKRLGKKYGNVHTVRRADVLVLVLVVEAVAAAVEVVVVVAAAVAAVCRRKKDKQASSIHNTHTTLGVNGLQILLWEPQ